MLANRNSEQLLVYRLWYMYIHVELSAQLTGGLMSAVTNLKSVSSRINVTARRLIKYTNWLTINETHVLR